MSPAANRGKVPSTPPNDDWTIMVYITADGTLANFAVESLKQLNKSVNEAAGLSGKPRVKVAAYFSFPGGATNPGPVGAEASSDKSPREYIFPPRIKSAEPRSQPSNPGQVLSLKPAMVELSVKKDEGKKPGASKGADKTDNAKISVKNALRAFLQAVYKDKDLKDSQHFALFLWGHGPELLLRPPAGNSTGDSVSLYLTPEELREVLTECRPPTEDSKLDIIGFDACFMSMLEMANELKDVAHYMVASQDEVPDLSFPYDKLVPLLQQHGGKADSLLKDGVEVYVTTYQDCICNNTTEMNPVTLTVLELDKGDALTGKVKALACALLRAKGDEGLPDGLIEARKSSKDYAGGLYVDLYDFCEKLKGQLGEQSDIGVACQGVIDALSFKSENPLILTNGSVEVLTDGTTQPLFDSDEATSHGISIYLPYLTDTQYAQAQRPLVKGTPGSHSGKSLTDVLNGAGSEYLMCVRRDLILATESYYPRLRLADETRWYDFITEVWTRVLMKKLPADLDYHYSAQQSWMNVTRGPVNIAKLCP